MKYNSNILPSKKELKSFVVKLSLGLNYPDYEDICWFKQFLLPTGLAVTNFLLELFKLFPVSNIIVVEYVFPHYLRLNFNNRPESSWNWCPQPVLGSSQSPHLRGVPLGTVNWSVRVQSIPVLVKVTAIYALDFSLVSRPCVFRKFSFDLHHVSRWLTDWWW